MKITPPKPSGPLSLHLLPLTLLGLALLPRAGAQSTWLPADGGDFSWTDAANWTPAIPNAVGAGAMLNNDIFGLTRISLDAAVTLGSLTIGDQAGGGAVFTVADGQGGPLTFDASAGNATLQRQLLTGANNRETLSCNLVLNDTLAADVRLGSVPVNAGGNAGAAGLPAGGMLIEGEIRGPGGLIRSGSVAGDVANLGGTLTITNNNNSYAGTTTVEHGALAAVLTGNILPGQNSVFGNAATAILVGTATLAPAAAANNHQQLRFIAGDDATNFELGRGIDATAVTQTGAPRVVLDFASDNAGGENTNRLTVSGPVTLGGLLNRAVQITVQRKGMMINFTGPVTSTSNVGISVGNFPANPLTGDGRGPGTVRFSNLERDFGGSFALNLGTVIIDGVVGPVGTPSPIGLPAIALANGGGTGNIFGAANFSGGGVFNDVSPETVRAIFLESAGSSYARTMAPGGGNSSTPAAGGYGANVNVINGFQFGGLNPTGEVVFSGPINPGNPNVGASPTNPVTTAINIALSAKEGGTVKFTGGINDTPSAAHVARITVNQFRNHPNLDGNNGAGVTADGLPDEAADQLVGTAEQGTVILEGSNAWQGTTEVLGGTLVVNGSIQGNTLTVVAGATLAGSGTINLTATNASIVVQAGARLDPGNPDFPGQPLTLDLGSGILNLGAVAGGNGWLRYLIGAQSDGMALTSGSVDLGSGLDLDDFAFTNSGGLPEGVYTLIETSAPLTGPLGSNVAGTLFGKSAVLAKSGDGTDLILTVGAGGGNSALQTWRQTHFGTTASAGNAANDFDADRDGVPNLVEYLQDTNPVSAASVTGLVNPARTGNIFTADYARKMSTLTDVEVIPETSPSMAAGSWTPVGVGQSQISTGAGFEVMRLSVTSANPIQFLRLRVRER